MSKRLIITIGRQHGSGGRTLGRLLAEHLGIEFYDKRLLEEVAHSENYNLEDLEKHDEKPLSFTALGFPMGLRNPYVPEYDAGFYVLSDRIYQAISGQIIKAANTASCVIVGRVADEVLKDDPDLVTIFVHGDEEDRIKRIMESDDASEKDARRIIKKTDKNREHYHDYYGTKKWGEADSYDICISTSRFGIEGAASILAKMLQDS